MTTTDITTNNLPQVFTFDNNIAIRTIVINGEPYFVAKDVALALEYSKFDSNLLLHVPAQWKDTNPIPTHGGTQTMLCLTEQGLYFFINRSDKPKALPFQMWLAGEVLPSIRKTGKFDLTQSMQSPLALNYEKAKLEIDFELFVQEKLKTSEVSKLAVVHSIYSDYGLSTKRLPQYVSNQRVQFSAKDLLLKNNIKMSSQKFNILLMAAGLLEAKERSSTSSPTGKKKFKALIQAGLQYGTNEVCPKNPNQTQPRYYEDTFMELFNLVCNSKVEEMA